MLGTNVIRTSAPARVNLIGEHVDYNLGYVLPTVLPRLLHVELTVRDDAQVRVASAQRGDAWASYVLGQEAPRHDWLDYVQGATKLLAGDGHQIRGFEARINSTVPVGSGLSSSAALSVALLRALRVAFELTLDDLAIARLGRRIENEFVGAMVGIMDPMACSVGREGHALFIDCQSMNDELIPLPAGADVVVINSGIAHRHAAGDYNTRRSECERASELLGVPNLRSVVEADLPRIERLPEPFRRRARHVVTENARVLATVDALRAGDWPTVGRLFTRSHASQRDDYEVSIPEIDLLVELALAQPAVFGARLTGGGFGGSIVALAKEGQGIPVGQSIIEAFHVRTGGQATLIAP